MLTVENFKTFIGYQEQVGPGPHTHGSLLEMKYEEYDWTKEIPIMTTPDLIERLLNDDKPEIRMQMQMTHHNVVCDKSLTEVLAEASHLLLTFPKFKTTAAEPYATNSAKTRVAMTSRRGVGNAQIGKVILYRGNHDYDCCMAIVKCGESYGIIKQEFFERYGVIHG